VDRARGGVGDEQRHETGVDRHDALAPTLGFAHANQALVEVHVIAADGQSRSRLPACRRVHTSGLAGHVKQTRKLCAATLNNELSTTESRDWQRASSLLWPAPRGLAECLIVEPSGSTEAVDQPCGGQASALLVLLVSSALPLARLIILNCCPGFADRDR